jgi:hypothetical protein
VSTLATVDDLEDMPGFDLDQFDGGTVTSALQRATSRIVGELGWDPFEAERTYRVRCVPYGTSIWLPAQHVTAVAVSADGGDLDVQADWWDESGRLDLDRYVRRGVVTYTAGWTPGDDDTPSEIPQALRDACLEAAMGLLRNPEQLSSKTDGPFSKTFVTPNRLTEVPDPTLDPYRILALA